MAYDSARGRVVLFGGYAGSYVQDTWEYDGANWTQVNPGSRPSARDSCALAYDSARGRVVLFGGDDGTIKQDTWEYDGANWTQLNPVSRPGARDSCALVYDGTRGRVVLFGGYLGSYWYAQDTWEYDGVNWTQLAPASRPSARYAQAVVYDSARSRALLFGGCIGSYSYTQDTWEYDGANWAQVNPATGPAARRYHAMTFDATRGRAVLFGGDDGSHKQDTWEYAPSPAVTELTFSQGPGYVKGGALVVTADFSEDLTTSATPVLTFSPAEYFSPAQPAASRLSPTRFTYSTTVTGTTPQSGASYVATVAASTVVDLVGNRQDSDWSRGGTADTSAPVVTLTYNREDRLYGAGTFQLTATFTEEITPAAPRVSIPGTLGGGSVSEVVMTPVVGRTSWTYSTAILACDTQGTRTVTLSAADASGNALASQPGNNTFSVEMPPAVLAVTFSRGLEGLPAGTWRVTVDYSEPVGATPELTWSAGTSTLTVGPAVRVSDTRFVFEVVVVGGATEPAFGDPFTLTVSGAADLLGNPQAEVALRHGRVQTKPADPGRCTWLQRSPSTRPSARSGSALAYDTARNRVVLFGGYAGSYVQDTWEYDGVAWTQASPSSRPSARGYHAMAYDSARGRVVLFGGYDSSYTYQQDTWEYDGANWAQVSPGSRPGARTGGALAYDSARGRVVLFGGYGGSYRQDTWEYDGTNWAELTPASRPSARYDHALAYDGARGRVVLFGGCTGSYSYVQDTWEYDGACWTQVSPASRPTARGNEAMAYDSARSRVLLFGGYDGWSRKQDTWEYDGANWTQVSSQSGPSFRNSHGMAYDSARGRAVLFGGYDGSNHKQDTWEYSPSPVLTAVTFSQGPGFLRAGALVVTADFSEDLTTSMTPALTFSPSEHFSPAQPAASRLSPTRFTYSTTATGTTAQSGESYVATLAAP
ncbi:MAG: hypothetical protein HY814_05930, partial [Candidatus Riflebacteria bacterium]|nr:hypothetical protein [Candidatus Riflebacteria bacterium]